MSKPHTPSEIASSASASARLRASLAIATAFALLGAIAACSEGSRRPGTEVAVFAVPQADNAIEITDSGTLFSNAEGTAITLQRAFVAVSRITLTTDCTGTGFAWLRGLQPSLDWIIAPAQAHVTESPTSIGAPTVIDLLATGAETEAAAHWLGSLSPPAQDYCGVETEVFAADEDAANLPPDFDMVGLSVVIEGSFGPDHTPFVVRSSQALRPARRLFGALLMLSPEQHEARIDLRWAFDRWFDGIDMPALARNDAATVTDLLLAVTENVTAVLKN